MDRTSWTTWRRDCACAWILALASAAGGAATAEAEAVSRPVMRIVTDMPYIADGHERQKLDLYLPGPEAAGPLPLIIWVHGGAWLAGSKDPCPAVGYVRRGYAVASINYRLSRHAIFPAQIQDCQAAVRWLRANAGEYGIDPNRFGVWGASAGGHLAALLGVCTVPIRTSEDEETPEDGAAYDLSSRVQAVCDFFGPTDFARMNDFWTTMDHDAANSPGSLLIGGPVQEHPDRVRRANPITYVTKDAPPFLIVHGDADPLVPHNQSELLYEALKAAGVEVTFYTVRGGGHGGFDDPEVGLLVERFFDKHLKP